MNTEKPLQDAVKHHIDEKDALNRKAQAANCAATVLADECGKLRKRVAELEASKYFYFSGCGQAERLLEKEAEKCDALQKRVAELEDFLVASRKQSASNFDAFSAAQKRIRELEEQLAEAATECAAGAHMQLHLDRKLKEQCETCEIKALFDGNDAFARKCKAELGEANKRIAELEAELAEWHTLRGWGGTPAHVEDFIKGQQQRIYAAQIEFSDLAAERAAHLATQRALVELEKFAFMSDQEYAAKCYDHDALVATAAFAAARAAVAKADEKEGQP